MRNKAMKEKRKRKSYEDDSDWTDQEAEENMPLRVISKKDVKKSSGNRLSALHQYSVENCEFCDEVFYNKYSMLIHNAKHIIIPLLKQQMQQCPECLHHFTSIESLEWHTINKHPTITREDYVPELLRSFVKKQPTILVKTPAEVNDTIIKKESLLQSFVTREPITVLTKEEFSIQDDEIYEISDSSDEDFVDNDTKVKIEMKLENDAIAIETDIICDNEFNDECVDEKKYFEYKTNIDLNDGPSIRNRLRFEDEAESGAPDIIKDLTTNCQVNLEMFDKNWIKGLQSPEETPNVNKLNNFSNNFSPSVKKNAIILGRKPNEGTVEMNAECKDWKSIHFEELIGSGIYRCTKCNQAFPNRYSGILHETLHLDFKRRPLPLLCRFCDWYISTAPKLLAAHIERHHPDRVYKPPTVSKCGGCGLGFVRQRRHLANYHQKILCSFVKCGGIFDTYSELRAHRRAVHARAAPHAASWNDRVARVCELCYSFLKNRMNISYQYYGEESQVGLRQQCERCNKYFFSLKLVRTRSKKHQKSNYNVEQLPTQRSNKRPLTNRERLNNVHMRLKKLKMINKF